MAHGRKQGMKVALGMGLAGLTYALIAELGIGAIVKSNPIVFLSFKIAGSAYLAYLGVMMLRHAKETPIANAEGVEPSSGFFQGLRTQLSNPKTVIVYASIFAALMPRSPEPWLLIALPVTIGIIESGWYVVVATLFATSRASSAYAKAKAPIDRVAGTVIILLAVSLAFLV
jgi:threonine/homoserine/homoserine lactone efflux protein